MGRKSNLSTGPVKPISIGRMEKLLNGSIKPTMPNGMTSPLSSSMSNTDATDEISIMEDIRERLDPEDALRSFGKFLREAQSRYEANERCIKIAEEATQDILHKIELSPSMNAANGFAHYRKLKTIRERRRMAKKENEMLQPLLDWLSENSTIITTLGGVQGKCRLARERTENCSYRQRTMYSEVV